MPTDREAALVAEEMVHRIANDVRERLQVESSSDRHSLGQRSNRLDGVDALEEALTAALAARPASADEGYCLACQHAYDQCAHCGPASDALDGARLDALEEMIRGSVENGHCEVYLSGLRRSISHLADEFQFETNPNHLGTVSGPTLRAAMDKILFPRG